jgi:hypothetical protein
MSQWKGVPANRRPISVTLLVCGGLIMAGLSLWRAVLAALQWRFLAEFAPWLAPYLLLSSAAWLTAWGALALAAWRLSPRSPGFARLLILGFAAHVWLDRLLLQDGGSASDLFFSAAVTLAAVSILLYLLRHKSISSHFSAH